MVTINEVGKAFSQSLASATPEEAARYFTELRWQAAKGIGDKTITLEECKARMKQIETEICSYLDKHTSGEVYRFNNETYNLEFIRMFKLWTLDSIRYIDVVLCLCDLMAIFTGEIEGLKMKLAPDDKTGEEFDKHIKDMAFFHASGMKAKRLKSVYLEKRREFITDSPWDRFGLDRPSEDEATADYSTITLADLKGAREITKGE